MIKDKKELAEEDLLPYNIVLNTRTLPWPDKMQVFLRI
jgi:hypothetical protein